MASVTGETRSKEIYWMDAKLFSVSLFAEDVQAAVHFYRDVIGLDLIVHDAHLPHFNLSGSYLVILPGQQVTKPDPGLQDFPLVAIQVPLLEVVLERLRHHGIEVTMGGDEAVGLLWAMFYDLSGNLIEVVEIRE
jgi:catechol 2,3-dioxygenase-like lactoylglutathione lyase family enzyme